MHTRPPPPPQRQLGAGGRANWQSGGDGGADGAEATAAAGAHKPNAVALPSARRLSYAVRLRLISPRAQTILPFWFMFHQPKLSSAGPLPVGRNNQQLWRDFSIRWETFCQPEAKPRRSYILARFVSDWKGVGSERHQCGNDSQCQSRRVLSLIDWLYKYTYIIYN